MDKPQPDVNRRQVIRAGALVAGAAWVAPALTVVGVSPAHADTASGTPTPPPTTPPTALPTTSTTTSTTSHPTVSGVKYGSQPPSSSALGGLPRTGAEIATAAAVGGGLVAAGIALRKVPGAAAQGGHRRGQDDEQ